MILADVNFRDVGTLALASVRYVPGDFVFGIGTAIGGVGRFALRSSAADGANRKIAVPKTCVGEPIAKREEGLSATALVSAISNENTLFVDDPIRARLGIVAVADGAVFP